MDLAGIGLGSIQTGSIQTGSIQTGSIIRSRMGLTVVAVVHVQLFI